LNDGCVLFGLFS